MIPLLKYWHHRIHPNVRAYLQKWRTKTLLLRKGLEMEDSGNPNYRLNTELQFSLVDPDNMTQQAALMNNHLKKLQNNPSSGFSGDVTDAITQLQNAQLIIADCITKQSRKANTLDTVTRANKKDIKTSKDEIEKVDNDLTAMVS